MPVSEKQLAANRRNASKSTGPRTKIGKSISAQNGQTHGLTAQSILLSPEEASIHQAFVAEYLAHLNPEGLLETELALSIGESTWRLSHARTLAMNLFAMHQTGESDIADAFAQTEGFLRDASKIALLSLYEQRIHRTLEKDRVELRALQAERKAAREAALEKAELFAQASYAEGKPYDASADFPVENGFGFSTEEINASLRDKRRYKEALKFFAARPDFQPALIDRKSDSILSNTRPQLTFAGAA